LLLADSIKTPKVTAKFKWAPEYCEVIAPTKTPIPQPIVIADQPAPFALLVFKLAAATTPFPNIIKSILPNISERKIHPI